LKSAESTIWSDMKELRAIFNKAIKKKITENYPFREYSVPNYKQPKRIYLTQTEVVEIEAYADKEGGNDALKKAAAWFLLSVYSGMRYGDLALFNESEYIKGGKLYFADNKEGNPHYIPIYPKLQTAIERVRQYPEAHPNSKLNRYIKEVAEIVGIDKDISIHKGRHTFAGTYVDNGGSTE